MVVKKDVLENKNEKIKAILYFSHVILTLSMPVAMSPACTGIVFTIALAHS